MRLGMPRDVDPAGGQITVCVGRGRIACNMNLRHMPPRLPTLSARHIAAEAASHLVGQRMAEVTLES